MKIWLLLPLVLTSCTTYYYYNIEKYLDLENKNSVQRAGAVDGCRSALGQEARFPSMLRNNSPFYINPELVYDPEYRTAWKDANTFCDGRFAKFVGNPVNQKPMFNTETRGNYVCLTVSC